MSQNLILNVYDGKGKVTKTSEAQVIDLEFGTIRSLMKVLNVENINDTGELLSVVYGAWTELTEILSQVFPDMSSDDWDHVKLKELIPVLMDVMRYSFAEILTLNRSKN